MKALVIYGTRWGGTIPIAEKIGEILKEEGFAVDVIDAKKGPKKISSYDLVVVGSGIRADKWTKETINFLEENAILLKTKKTALFVSCQMADGKKEAKEKAKTFYLEKIAENYGLKPISLTLFGGFLDFHKSHGLFVDILLKVNRVSLRKNGLDTSKTYDTRDWSNIETWARQIARRAIAAENFQ
jgi:menaquinone-dependent protoporphyrinogen oxidase